MDGQVHSGLNIVNLEQARYECVYPACGGICCRQGRPAVEPDEQERIQNALPRVLSQLRPEVQEYLTRKPVITPRIKEGLPTLAVVGQWCVFHNNGCVLHRLGAEEGDRFAYKPWRCSAFPLDRSADGEWKIRQWGEGEAWDLFCLNPDESPRLAKETIGGEIEFIERVEAKYFGGKPPAK